MTQQAVLSDGRWVVLRQGEPGDASYSVGDTVEKKTIPASIGNPYFQTMSSDGSKVFFLETERPRTSSGAEEHAEQGELYVLDPATGVKRDLTAGHLDGEPDADVQNTVIASEDGSYVYFVATGVLASGAQRGADNFYVLHGENGQWTTTYIATLAGMDRPDWRPGDDGLHTGGFDLRQLATRVSPDGRYVAFMSARSLTGYDNLDALSGQPDEEVYLYDAASNRLVCASCNPTGARPLGVLDAGGTGFTSALVIDIARSWQEVEVSSEQLVTVDSWVAGVLPGAWNSESTISSYAYSTYQPRDLFNSGRLFFNSTDALVPQDTNGVADVYEYEPPNTVSEPPPNDSCTTSAPTYNAAKEGCVSLISSGQSTSESAFADASETGDDVFFVTNSKLVSEDRGTAYELYDAHVCASGWPCQAAPVSPPPCTSADSCKPAPLPQPEVFGSPPSESFNGAGNLAAAPPPPTMVTKRTVRCKQGFVKNKRGKCIKRPKQKKTKAKKSVKGRK